MHTVMIHYHTVASHFKEKKERESFLKVRFHSISTSHLLINPQLSING